ncbi:MAG: hypothetical protein KJN98_06845, partial [Pontiella sp.]|nr:hypothetical protein [Pontiella sp.]
MTDLVPDIHDIRIFQKLGRLDAKSLEAADQLLLILPARPTAAEFRKLPQGSKLQAVMRKHPANATPAFTSRLSNNRQTLVVAGKLAADASAFEQLTLGRKLIAAATSQKAASLGICAVGFDSDATATIVNNMLAAALAAACTLPSYKSKETSPRIKSIRLLGLSEKLDTTRTEA